MKRLTIAYANHRPETIRLSEPLMRDHQAVVLEEPPHPALPEMLDGRLNAADYLLDQDIEYPAFSTEQCHVLRNLHQIGVNIIQVEPYFEHLFTVQNFFADGHRPDELDRTTEQYQVYMSEKEATGSLIAYYKSVRGNDFQHTIESVKAFARADASRFKLRDRLRAEVIARQVQRYQSVCVEGGPMHLLLFQYLRGLLPSDWLVRPVFVELRALQELGCRAGLYSPGDVLTAHYLLDHAISVEQQDLLTARALIFMKIVEKEEFTNWHDHFPHLRNECRANRLVSQLSYDHCKGLFAETKEMSTDRTFQLVQTVSSKT